MGKDRGDTITRELHPSLARRVGNPSHVPSPLRTVTDANSPQSAVQPAQWSFQMPSSLRFGTFDQNNPVANNPLTAIEVFFCLRQRLPACRSKAAIPTLSRLLPGKSRKHPFSAKQAAAIAHESVKEEDFIEELPRLARQDQGCCRGCTRFASQARGRPRYR